MVALLIDVLLIAIVVNFIDHRGNLELVALAIYGAVMWKLRGSTVGGIIFDLRVVRIDGRPVDWETAIVRALGCFLSMVVAGLGSSGSPSTRASRRGTTRSPGRRWCACRRGCRWCEHKSPSEGR